MHFSALAALHHRSTASEDQRYEEASQHRSGYCCARDRYSRFGTAHRAGPDCEHGHRAGCYSSRGYGPSSPLHNLNAGSGLFGAAPSMKVEGSAAPVAPGTESFQLLRQ